MRSATDDERGSTIDGLQAVDAKLFREALRNLAAGVSVITTRDESGDHYGFAATAVTSVSLDPPLIMVAVDHSSKSHPALVAGRPFAIHVLADDQRELARLFAGKRTDKLESTRHSPGVTGVAVLDGALAVLECRHHRAIEAGDHTIVLGEVVAADSADGHPLVHFRGDFTDIERTASNQRKDRR